METRSSNFHVHYQRIACGIGREGEQLAQTARQTAGHSEVHMVEQGASKVLACNPVTDPPVPGFHVRTRFLGCHLFSAKFKSDLFFYFNIRLTQNREESKRSMSG